MGGVFRAQNPRPQPAWNNDLRIGARVRKVAPALDYTPPALRSADWSAGL